MRASRSAVPRPDRAQLRPLQRPHVAAAVEQRGHERVDRVGAREDDPVEGAGVAAAARAAGRDRRAARCGSSALRPARRRAPSADRRAPRPARAAASPARAGRTAAGRRTSAGARGSRRRGRRRGSPARAAVRSRTALEQLRRACRDAFPGRAACRCRRRPPRSSAGQPLREQRLEDARQLLRAGVADDGAFEPRQAGPVDVGRRAALVLVAADERDACRRRRDRSPARRRRPARAMPAGMPGTTSNGMPCSCRKSASSPPRSKTNGSPHFSRATSLPSRAFSASR